MKKKRKKTGYITPHNIGIDLTKKQVLARKREEDRQYRIEKRINELHVCKHCGENRDMNICVLRPGLLECRTCGKLTTYTLHEENTYHKGFYDKKTKL